MQDSLVQVRACLPSLMLCRAPLVVEADNVLGGSAHVSDDETDSREEHSLVPLNLCYHTVVDQEGRMTVLLLVMLK